MMLTARSALGKTKASPRFSSQVAALKRIFRHGRGDGRVPPERTLTQYVRDHTMD